VREHFQTAHTVGLKVEEDTIHLQRVHSWLSPEHSHSCIHNIQMQAPRLKHDDNAFHLSVQNSSQVMTISNTQTRSHFLKS
jgi:hypothetical protein